MAALHPSISDPIRKTTDADANANANESRSIEASTSITNTTASGRSAPSASENPTLPAPPYWTARQRTISNISYCSVQNKFRRQLITLQDNTEREQGEYDDGVWAKSVTIEDYVVVGARGLGEWGPGSYVVFNCTVDTLEGGPIKIIKRYSEFDDLRERLLQTFPLSEASLPSLPPKSVISKFRPKFLEKRQEGLSYFLNFVLLNPQFAGSRVLKDWVFAI